MHTVLWEGANFKPILMSQLLTPSTIISPSVTSKNLGIRFISVDFPLPVLPMKAVVLPECAVNVKLRSEYYFASGYLKETFLNSTTPFLSGTNGTDLVYFVSSMLIGVSITS